MALSVQELLQAIDKLQGKDLKKVKDKLSLKATDSNVKAEGETDAQFEKRLKQEAEMLDIKAKQARALGEYNTAIQIEFELERKLANLKGDAYTRINEEILTQMELIVEARKLGDEKSAEELEQELKKLENIRDTNLEIEKQIEKIQELRGEQEELTEIEKERFEYLTDQMSDIAVHLGLNSKGFNNLVKKYTKLKEIDQKNPGMVTAAIKETLSLQKLAGAVAFQVLESSLRLATAIDKATAAFAAQTGAGRVLTDEIGAVGNSFRNLGIDAADAGKAAGALFENFTGFMQLQRIEQENLMQTVAALEKIGVDGMSAANSLNILTKNFGMSTKEATKLTKQLSIMGTELGISSKKMVEGFNAASRTLAVYGKESVKIFADIAAQAKAASVETSTLLGIAEQFDTFEGATKIAGRLNAMLGSQLSTTELLTMKENERIEAIIRTMQVYGGSFKDLDRFTQKSLANVIGVQDMAEAQRILGLSLSDYRKGLRQTEAEEEFNKRLKDSMDIFKKLEQIGKQFAIQMSGAVEVLSKVLQFILDVNEAMGGKMLMFIGVLGGLTILGKALAFMLPLMPTFGGLATLTSGGLSALGAAAGANAVNFAKGGGALILFAAGVGALFGAFALLSGLGVAMDGAAIFGLMSGFAGGLIAIGGAIGIIGVLVTKFGPIMAVGLGAVLAGLSSIGAVLSGIIYTMNEKKLKALGQIFSGMGDMMVNFKVGAFVDSAKFLKEIKNLDASIKPVLGDLALIATGQTNQSLTTSATNYDFSQFTANLENVFKPQVKVYVGNEELKSYIGKQVSKKAQE